MKNLLSTCIVLCSLTSTAALANPIIRQVTFTCPCIDQIEWATDHIQGLGNEYIKGINNPIVYKSYELPNPIPLEYSNYSSSSIEYNSATSFVGCTYESSDPTQPAFTLYYKIMNGSGGVVMAQSNSSMMVDLPIG